MIKKVSRLLSNVLRHKPENIGIVLDKHGWTDVKTLLDQLEENGKGITNKELVILVETNDKKRFEFSEDGEMIRACQGHSVKVDLELKNERPPLKLYHGTVEKSLKGIFKDGLNKMKRHSVHLSEDIPTATNVGSRRGEAIILEIQSARMFIDGYKFHKSNNGVWLTDSVPSKYIRTPNNEYK